MIFCHNDYELIKFHSGPHVTNAFTHSEVASTVYLSMVLKIITENDHWFCWNIKYHCSKYRYGKQIINSVQFVL